MSKGFLGVIVLVVLIFVGIFAFSGNKTGTSTKSSGTPTNHIEGQGKSGITLVEYGDYQCPYCEQAYPIIKQVQAEFNDQVYLQFRNFPLPQHQNAFASARAAEAAGMQGKFWQMHDLLYDNQSQWSESNNSIPFFKQYAKQLGLNAAQFDKDYASGAVNDAINADKAAGNKLNVSGTPTFFLNGKQLSTNQSGSLSAFEKTIKDAIAQKSRN